MNVIRIVSEESKENLSNGPKDGCHMIDNKSVDIQKIIHRDIATINGKINAMDEKKLSKKFGWFKYEDKNDLELYRKAVKTKLANIIMSNYKILYKNDQVLPYYVVIDFEATCEASNPPEYRHEIIEFPAILVNSRTLEIEDRFRRICRPTLKPELSEFCMQLTDITQEQVDAADPFSVVLSEFEQWLSGHKLKNFCVVTDGPYDICRFLYTQCAISRVPYPKWAEEWLDLRRVFMKFYNERRCALARMLDAVGLTFEGRPHCGIDDATNIARLLIRMAYDGARLMPNQTLSRTSRAQVAEPHQPDSILNELSLTAENNQGGKFLTIRDVKIQRSRKIHELIKTMQMEGTDLSEGLLNCRIEEIEECSSKTKRKKRKHKKKFQQ